MLFNSFQFLVFFPIVTLIYFLLPHKWRWFHLLISSCIFYAAFIPIYILILLLTIVIDYIAGIVIENASGKKRKAFLILSVIVNVGVLAVFKYNNFFIENLNELFQTLHIHLAPIPLVKIILPIGLSFHTFQAMSYTIEVYRGNQKAEKHFGIYALYVMFYPQLVAGPIERPQNMLHQFYEKKYFVYDNVVDGLKLMMWGLFKKMVIADRLAGFTDPVFNSPHQYSSIVILIATFFFAFQIFCDFSGYSDIALGAAKVMGFKLMQNFNRPYHAKSISEFWKRWHISLSTWFRDYLYFSLGGNRVSVPRWYFNLFFVFLVSGFWHGANWTFVCWGALHGFYLVFAIVTEKPREKIWKSIGIKQDNWFYNFVQVCSTFVLVAIAWIFFRANSVRESIFILKQIPHAILDLCRIIAGKKYWIGKMPFQANLLYLCFGLIFFLELVHYFQRKRDFIQAIKKSPIYFRWSIYYLGIIAIILLGVYEKRQFIYFQF